jgi:uncharacterized ion transporter superfamily protein YfcC
MFSFLSILKLLKGFNLKTIGIVAAVLAGVYFVYDYANTKNEKYILENKITQKNQEIINIQKEYKKNITMMYSKVEEQQKQKNDLIDHNKLLQKTLRRKSNVNTKAKDFKSRNLVRITR